MSTQRTSEFRAGHKGDLNPNWKGGHASGDNREKGLKEYYKKYYQERKVEHRSLLSKL